MIENDTIESLQDDWRNPYKQWHAAGMPMFHCVNKEPWKQIKIKFRSMEDRERFGVETGFVLTEKTNVVWYPEKGREKNNMSRYVEYV